MTESPSLSPSPDSGPNPPQPATRPITARFWITLAFIVSLLLGGSYLMKHALSRFELSKPSKLPILKQVRAPFAAVERSGALKNLADLKGKAVVMAYAYTRCPHGCAGVAAQMLKIRDLFPASSNVHLVSVAVWPDIDNPPTLKAFAESLKVSDQDAWWWLSTDRQKTWDFMTREVGFGESREVPEKDRLNPFDVVEHDLRAVLIDKDMRVRAFYSLMHPQTEVAAMALEKLERDLRIVLSE